MIKIALELGYSNELISLKAVGHANAGAKGTDIVCSAVSAILRTVVLSLFDKENELRTNLNVDKSGELYFEVIEYNSSHVPKLQYASEFLQKGIESIQVEKPDSVSLTVSCICK